MQKHAKTLVLMLRSCGAEVEPASCWKSCAGNDDLIQMRIPTQSVFFQGSNLGYMHVAARGQLPVCRCGHAVLVFPAQPILLEFLDGSVNHQFSYTQDDPVNQCQSNNCADFEVWFRDQLTRHKVSLESCDAIYLIRKIFWFASLCGKIGKLLCTNQRWSNIHWT